MPAKTIAANNPEPTQPASVEGQARAIERRTAQAAKAQRTTRVVVPRENGDEKNFDIPVIINGHTFLIQRGVPVEVPDMVLDVLMHAGLL
ncbi:MAG: hypothetical protein ACOYJA_07385 [Christensenellales bacterium]|jgi:hypothetical protein